MKKIIVCSAAWFPSSGGLTILHKFVNELNTLGYDAYIAPTGPSGLGWHPNHIPFDTSHRYSNVKMITSDLLNNLNECIVVYPETWYGNLLNAPNVVRWIMGPVNPRYMNAGSLNGFYYDSWKDSDLWFWYSQLYTQNNFTSVTKNFDNQLNVVEFYTDIFRDYGRDRFLNCWTLRKSTNKINAKSYIHSPEDLFFGDIDKTLPNPDFDFPGKLQDLSDLFNITNLFYSYDAYTFVSVQSVMCGATSIVYPMDGLDSDSYYNGHPLHRYNAYGVEDIERALSVRNELLDHINEIQTNSTNDIHNFIEKCHDYFK